jgi:hypothetical protein
VSVPSGASRAQRLALAAALGGQGLLGCTETTATPVYGAPVAASPSQPSGGKGVAAGSGGGPVAVPVYGAPLAGQPAPVKPPADAGQMVTPVYGAPLAGQPAPRPDAGHSEEDAGPADAGVTDAGVTRDGGPMVHPLYGAPVPPYGLPPTPKN